jgi:pilus assembly protein CpaE
MSSGHETIRILIVDDIPETRESLRKMLYFEPDMEVVGTAGSGEEAIELSREHQPHVVLMDINMPGLDGISASEAITREVPFAQVVMMSVQGEADYLRRSMLAGARDFLTKPFTMDEMISTVRRVFEMSAHVRTEDAATRAGHPEIARPMAQGVGKLVAVYSPKGGVGCTTLTVNVATAMCQLDPSLKVAIIDGRLQFGVIKIMLDLRVNRSIVDLVDNIDELDVDLVESTMVRDERSGLRVLLAPPKPEMADMVSAEHVRAVLDHLREMFDYVLIDMGSRLQDLELGVFDLADRIVLVLTPDLPAITSVRYFFELVEALGYPSNKVLMVLNKTDSRQGLNARVIENHLKHEVFAEIPLEDRIVLHSINHGIPYMIAPGTDRKLPLYQQTSALAEQLIEALEMQAAELIPDLSESAQRRPLG